MNNPILGAILHLIERVGELERRQGQAVTRGRVTDVDPEKGLARIKIGEDDDGNPVKSPWVRYAQTAGELKIHDAPSVGQQMEIVSDAGDMELGTMHPTHWSEGFDSPSTEQEPKVLTYGDVKITLTKGGLEVEAPAVTFKVSGTMRQEAKKVEMESDDLEAKVKTAAFEGDRMTHNGNKIDGSHQHKDVAPGGALTGPPVP